MTFFFDGSVNLFNTIYGLIVGFQSGDGNKYTSTYT